MTTDDDDDDDDDGDDIDADDGRHARGGRRRRRGGPTDRVTMRLAAAELVESREILPGQWLQSFHAPELAIGSRAGQFVHVKTGDYSGMILRRPFSINTADPSAASSPSTSGSSAAAPAGSPGFAPATRSRCSGRWAGRSRSIRAAGTCCSSPAAWAWPASGCWPTRRSATAARSPSCSGPPASREVYPSSLLPDEIEYVVATDDGSLGHHGYVTELVADYESWADQAFACGPTPMLGALARLAASRRDRLGVATLGRKRVAASRTRSARRPPGARPSCRSRWSRTWAARWGPAWAAWS